jgi:hypothetical protein
MFGASDNKSDFPEYDFERLKNQNFIHISCLIRKKCTVGTGFDEYLSGRSHEDWDFFLVLGSKGVKFKKCDNTFLHYRIHSQGRNNYLHDTKDRLKYLTVCRYIINKHIDSGDQGFDYLQTSQISEWYHELYSDTAGKIRDLEERNIELSNHIVAFKNSNSYRIGRLVTLPVRKLKDAATGVKSVFFRDK